MLRLLVLGFCSLFSLLGCMSSFLGLQGAEHNHQNSADQADLPDGQGLQHGSLEHQAQSGAEEDDEDDEDDLFGDDEQDGDDEE